MKQNLMPYLALILLVFAIPVGAATLTAEQLLDLKQVRTVDLSPDGKLAAYTVSYNRSLDDDAGGAWTNLYLMNLKFWPNLKQV